MIPQLFTVDTPWLRVAYDEWNPGGARTVVLVHGWPDSPRTWAHVAPVLAAAGWRVLAPALRGHGGTRFLRDDTPRTGQLAALGRDLLEFIAALGLQQPALVGHDWGARAVANACGLMPGVASHLALLSVGYGTNSPNQPLSLAQARNYWYQWYMNTPRGQATLQHQRHDFARLMWDSWTDPGWYEPAEFAATAAAFDNPDWPAVVEHSYRHRLGHLPGDPTYAADDAALQPAPVLQVPTLMLHGGADRCTLPETSEGKEHFFSGPYRRVVLPGLGHFPQREAPETVAQALLAFLTT